MSKKQKVDTNKKGNRLEEAIENIMKMHYNEIFDFNKTVVRIERKKVTVIKGVKDEADLLVTINPDTDTQIQDVYECKNWDKKIRKDEAIVLNHKVEKHFCANKGFLVCKDYYSGAKNVIDAYFPRLKIIKANDDLEVIWNEVGLSFHPKILSGKAVIWMGEPGKKNSFRAKKEQLESSDEIYDKLREKENTDYVKKHLDERIKKIEDEGRVGKHNIHAHYKLSDIDTININGIEYSEIYVEVFFEVFIYEIKLESRFDVKSKGRYLEFTFTDTDGEIKKMKQTIIKHHGREDGKTKTIRFDFEGGFKI